MHRAISGTWHVDAMASSPVAKAYLFHSASTKQPARPNFLETNLEAVCKAPQGVQIPRQGRSPPLASFVYPISCVCVMVGWGKEACT
jgi:hypothetical protein